jgi:hypothetical protein
MKRRAAVEPAIGPTPEHRLGRNYLKDRANAVLAAADYNFSLAPSSRCSFPRRRASQR